LSRAGQHNNKDWDNHEEEEEESFCSNESDDQLMQQQTLNHDQNEDEHDGGSRVFMGKTAVAKLKSQPRSFCFGLQTIHAPSWLYFIVALVAVEARYLIFLSFRFTSFTFIYLVDALAIPSAMLFSKLLLKREYHFVHLLGGFICICGIVTNTVFDLKGSGSEIGQLGSRDDVNSRKYIFFLPSLPLCQNLM
jgi:solute carrier family 35 protein F1/2